MRVRKILPLPRSFSFSYQSRYKIKALKKSGRFHPVFILVQTVWRDSAKTILRIIYEKLRGEQDKLTHECGELD